MSWRALALDAAVSKLRRASTSVETRFGTIFRISTPKATASPSMAAASASLVERERFLASVTTRATSSPYSGMVAALSSRLGLVVASRGWYLRIEAKSPVSATTIECCFRPVRRSVMTTTTPQSSPQGKAAQRCAGPALLQRRQALELERLARLVRPGLGASGGGQRARLLEALGELGQAGAGGGRRLFQRGERALELGQG